MSPWGEYELTKAAQTRHKNKRGGYCLCHNCNKKLEVGDKVVSKGSGGGIKARKYCSRCARELNLI